MESSVLRKCNCGVVGVVGLSSASREERRREAVNSLSAWYRARSSDRRTEKELEEEGDGETGSEGSAELIAASIGNTVGNNSLDGVGEDEAISENAVEDQLLPKQETFECEARPAPTMSTKLL